MMKDLKRFVQNIKFALKGLTSNKLSSMLTLLGIVIGIGSVIGLMGIGQGTQDNIVGDLEDLGTNIMIITPGARRLRDDSIQPGASTQLLNQRISDGGNTQDGLSLRMSDYEFLQNENIDNINQISFTLASSREVSFNGNKGGEIFPIVCTDETFFNIYDLETTSGNLFNQDDIENLNYVAVLGSEVAALGYDVGDILTIQDYDFEIIGVLSEKEESLLGTTPNQDIYLPYSIVQSLTENPDMLSSIIVQVEDENLLVDTIDQVESKLISFRVVEEADFTITSIQTLITTVQGITDTFTLLLTGIAAISLLVGGIGISNVMLITVTQRTREIGIRKAVGARRSDILIQFLVEAVLLTLIGGILGIFFGILLGQLAQAYMGFPSVITVDSIFLAVGISVGIGILFGILPANKASKLNPIDALRYE